MCFQPAAIDEPSNCAATRRCGASKERRWLALVALSVVCVLGSALPARALSVTGIGATANCDAVTAVSITGFSPNSTAATVRDGAGILIAWVGVQGPFVPFEGPADNTQWTVNDGVTSITITPSTFASQCAPASLTVEVGNFNAVVVRGHTASPPSKTYAVGNTGGSAIYQPATPYFPGGVAFFDLSGATTIGPSASAGVTLTFNAAASHLAPGSYSATIAFSNAAKLSLVTTRQITLTVVANTPHDFNDDAKSDILWRNVNSGGVAMWLMNSNTIQSFAGVGSLPMNWSIVGSRDMNRDGFGDILWYHSSGVVAVWFMNSATIISAVTLGSLPVSWSIVGTGDFNNDGFGDILWRDSGGNVAIWFLNSSGAVQSSVAVGNVPINWQIVGTGDFNADGIQDILWRENTAGGIAIWLMNSNGTIKSAIGLGSIPITDWTIVATGDFDGDGVSDILWRNSAGGIAMWLMNSNGTIKSSAGLGSLSITDWTVAETGDFDGDGKSDILWRHSSGAVALWLMNGGTLASALGVGSLTTDWQIQSANAD
jgi:hypothetical protein